MSLKGRRLPEGLGVACGLSAPPGAQYQAADPWQILGKIFPHRHWGSRHMCFRSVLIESASEALTSCHLVCKIFAESFDLTPLLKQQSHDQRKLLWAHSLPRGTYSCKLDPTKMRRSHTAVPRIELGTWNLLGAVGPSFVCKAWAF